MSSKMVKVQLVVEVLKEGADSLKYRDLQSVNENLKTALHSSHGVKLSTITVVADLLKEIKKLAVVRQKNNVNTLALMTAKQERDEPVRHAAVCDLSPAHAGPRCRRGISWFACPL